MECDSRIDHARVVADHKRTRGKKVGKLIEFAMSCYPVGARKKQPAGVALLKRMTRNAVIGQTIVEILDFYIFYHKIFQIYFLTQTIIYQQYSYIVQKFVEKFFTKLAKKFGSYRILI